jgi:hypothetical protein
VKQALSEVKVNSGATHARTLNKFFHPHILITQNSYTST